ncbi:hypothetical protein E4T42_01204 [Aureobasidium subglaciale]|uniref:UBA domain-containing protein n=1 Tax=Aureobasidium subglaciale (strain EXF-2481) TaxID=1043005 RepID=A0A074YVV3_AURSE|nr:uncharacterized protein AUEXF2481DRAFT_231 [Aureobasidium subglaciale EXF-2481]KAI5212180.1 hypothetical protein E4T38_00701 [Aureobasidium subglaciale]KAI5231246.1 hypothetical protein E4T40_00702 [Aureobasidium subglaciale]KAI5234150.1 hypothetical protein E4T41_00700 [Aureobasidium subglaciale]KAI5257134.1 hypothetical protein E4T42_01204 [Aureobasidium subglaciale]KAI5267694.1 hypothetical protein E4T46_00700 [Aureobasidium subglaciale]
MSSEIDNLVDMGFDREKAALAMKKAGNLGAAVDWLSNNADKSIEELKENEGEEESPLSLQPGELARSLLCKDCGKKFRSTAQAEFHANKTEHQNFEESTEEIAPLTEEEKAARLVELREKLAAKRAGQSEQDKQDKIRNDQIRRKATKEQQDIKEDLAKKEQIKEAEAKRREKQADVEAKKRIQAKIAADKEERRLKSEREKAARAGQPVVAAEPTPAAKPTLPKTAGNYTEARLRLQTSAGTVQRTFPVETTLFEVAQALGQEPGVQVTEFVQNYPKKVYDSSDFGQTLKEAGLVPSAALVVR